MKKTIKPTKLTLATETVRQLTPDRLEEVKGGLPTGTTDSKTSIVSGPTTNRQC